MLREEKAIETRDNLFGAFIRSLGRSSEASGTTISDGVKRLAMHSFGPLTKMVKNLSKKAAAAHQRGRFVRHFPRRRPATSSTSSARCT